MLIINADDLGLSTAATDSIINCAKQGLITSTSLMVFMKDSQRATEMSAGTTIEAGLHLNLSQPFDQPQLPSNLIERHRTIVRYLGRGKWARFTYNPFIAKALDYIYKAQHDEYRRLFGREPAKIDGHRHLHLCMNMLVDQIIPLGSRVRRNLSFEPGEKSPANRTYRKLIDAWLKKRYICTDLFFGIEPEFDRQRLQRILRLAMTSNVELMVHPEKAETLDYLTSRDCQDLIESVPKGTYRMLI
jgi:predicted glycoside hydrolase/deacetylase ChbG (UPF0249 family)